MSEHHEPTHGSDGPTPGEGPPRDGTLGGYFREHNRPPGFEGCDGEPYTVSLEAEKTPNLAAPYEGYLVFLRWASSGIGVVGHLESATLRRGRSREAVLEALGELSISEVKTILDQAIVQARADDPATGRATR